MTQALPTHDDGALADAVPGLWSPERRGLTVGLVLTITLVAFESLAVATVMPDVKDDLGGLGLYGWVFSAFFLASLLGIVVAGQLADRRGLVLPFAAGLVLFAGGLVIGGLAGSMPILIVGRVLQGFGAGAIPAVSYASIGRGYPASLRPRMFATTSTAWVVPGLVGPGIATLVEHAASWRWVFLGLLPIVAVAAAMAIPALRALGAHAPDAAPEPAPGPAAAALAPTESAIAVDDEGRLRRVALLVLGVGAVMGAGAGAPLALAVVLVAAGLPLAAWAFVGLVPPGTVRLRPGVPATVAVRGLLTGAFFAADTYVPLAVVDGRGGPTWLAGLALTATCITWTTASWTQARLIDSWGPRRLDRTGFAAIGAGVVGMLAVSQGLPAWVAVPVWSVAGFGIGLAFAPLSITVLAAARPGEEGSASAALQLSDTLGIAVGTGVAGWLVATGDHRGWTVASGVTAVYAFALLATLVGWLAARRLPAHVPAQAT